MPTTPATRQQRMQDLHGRIGDRRPQARAIRAWSTQGQKACMDASDRVTLAEPPHPPSRHPHRTAAPALLHQSHSARAFPAVLYTLHIC